jgi:hypothetical protein
MQIQQLPTATSVTCPRCSSTSVRRSPRNLWDKFLAATTSQYPYRCRNCRTRFHVVAQQITGASVERPRKESAKRRNAAKRRQVMIYALAAAMFVVFLVYLEIERG